MSEKGSRVFNPSDVQSGFSSFWAVRYDRLILALFTLLYIRKLSGMIWKPVRYLTIHFIRYHRGAASLRLRNRAEITVLVYEQKPSPLWFSCQCENYPVEWEHSLTLLRRKLFDFERWHWSSHVLQTRPWSGVVGIRYFWPFFLPCFCHNFGCKFFFVSHESRREKSDLRVLTSEAGH